MSRLQTKQDRDEAAARLFGYQPPRREGERPTLYDAREFRRRFGVDIERYNTFYAETAQANAPTGPCTPASARIPIRPILAIRQQPDGTYQVEGLSLNRGFFNREKTRAWVLVDDFMKLMGDPYFEEMERQLAAEREELMRQVRVLQDSDMSEEELAAFKRVQEGTPFEDLDNQERKVIRGIMQRLQAPPPQE